MPCSGLKWHVAIDIGFNVFGSGCRGLNTVTLKLRLPRARPVHVIRRDTLAEYGTYGSSFLDLLSVNPGGSPPHCCASRRNLPPRLQLLNTSAKSESLFSYFSLVWWAEVSDLQRSPEPALPAVPRGTHHVEKEAEGRFVGGI